MVRHASWLLILMLLLGCLPVSAAYAQQPPGALTVEIDGANVANYPQVALTLVVRDAFGRVVTDLTPDDFEVFEDDSPTLHRGVSLERVLNRDLPVYVVLAVDASGSMQGRPIMDARAAARTFIEQMNPSDEVGLIGFKMAVASDTVDDRLEHRPTTDHTAVLKVVDSLRAAGGTPLYDALNKAVQWALEMPPFNRAIVLFTDGVDEDPGSTVGADIPVQAAARANIPVFTIGLQGIGGRLAREFLQGAADNTGGSYQETPDSGELIALFRDVLDRPKQQHRLVFRTDVLPDGQVHRVRVRVKVGDQSGEGEGTFGPVPFIPTPTPTPTITPTPTPTSTPTVTPTPPPTYTPTPTATATQTPSPTPSATNTPQPTATFTATPVPTSTPPPTATFTATPRPTNTPTPAPTATPRPTNTSAPAPTATPRPTNTSAPAPTATPVPPNTPTPAPTATPVPPNTPTPAPTATPVPPNTPTPAPTATPVPPNTPTSAPTATPRPTNTPTPAPTATPVPTYTPTPVPTNTPTLAPTATPRPTDTPTPAPTATSEPTNTSSLAVTAAVVAAETTRAEPAATSAPAATSTPAAATTAAAPTAAPTASGQSGWWIWLIIGLVLLAVIVLVVVLGRRRG